MNPNVFAAPGKDGVARPPLVPALALASLWGIDRNLMDKLKAPVPPDLMTYGAEAAALIVLGGVGFGVCWLFGAAWTTSQAARLLGASVPSDQVRGVMATSCWPRVGSVALLFLLFVATGDDFLVLDRPGLIEAHPWAALPLLGAMIFGLWSWFKAVVGLADAGGMSGGRALVVYMLGQLAYGVVVVAVTFLLFALGA